MEIIHCGMMGSTVGIYFFWTEEGKGLRCLSRAVQGLHVHHYLHIGKPCCTYLPDEDCKLKLRRAQKA